MKFSLAFVSHEQNILLMSSFLLGNYCSLFPCGRTFCCTAWLSLWRNMNACCGYLFLLPGTAGTKVNVRLPLPQTITNFSRSDSGFKRLHARALFSYLRIYPAVSGLTVYQEVTQELGVSGRVRFCLVVQEFIDLRTGFWFRALVVTSFASHYEST